MPSIRHLHNLLICQTNNKTGELNEDQAKDEEDKVQKMTDKYIKQIDEAVEAKSKEIMTV